MKKMMIVLLILATLLIFTAGCNLPSSVKEPDRAEAAKTFAAQTIEVRLTENAAEGGQASDDSGQDDQAETPAPPEPQDATDTPEPSNTPQPSPTNTEAPPCNQASFVKDVTVPDGEEYAPDTNFTKTWRLKNAGSCTWNDSYDLVFDSGDQMGGANVEDINPGSVSPGDTVDISVDLKSPGSTGDYKGNWLLRSDDGVVFGLGDNDKPFFVQIEVVEAVSFEIINEHVYACGMDTYVSLRVDNTGTEELESSGGSAKNLDTDVVTNYLFWNTPFTEEKNDCPTMGIDNIDPGDIYWVTYNMGSASSVEYEYSLTLCTGESGGGDCTTRKEKVTIP